MARPYLDRTPEGALYQIFSHVEAEDLARLSCASSKLRIGSENFAQLQVKQREWRLLDGATATERLASEIVYFDADAFRAVGRDAPRLRSARRQGSRARLRVAPPPGSTRATRSNNVPVAAFSEHGSLMKVQRPGRYRVSGVVEPALKRRRLNPEDEARRERLAFQVKVAAVDPRSSIYVGVATKRWARTRARPRPSGRKSAGCWIYEGVDSCTRFRPMIRPREAAHGARARYHATSDDTVVEGDVLGVRVIDGAAHFFRNGRRLAFSAGGRGSNQLQDAGWGRPIPLSQDLVPIVEVHAREPDDDDEAMAPLALQLGAWRPPPYYHGQSLQARRILGDDPVRRFNTGEFADVWPSITNDPALRDITQPVPEREQLTFRSLRIVICSVLPLLPLIAGLSHTLLDVGGFGIGVACSTWRPAPILWLLGLLFRRAADSIALSLAVSAVWKCHFYDRRRPRRTRRGLRKLLQMHLLKCFGVALAVALLPSSLVPREGPPRP